MTKKIKLKPKNSGGSSKKPKRGNASMTGQQLSLREKPRLKATRSKPGSGSTSALARVKRSKEGSSSRQPGQHLHDRSDGVMRIPRSVKASKKKGDSLGSYRIVDGVQARVPSRANSELHVYEVEELDIEGNVVLSVTCPRCGESFIVDKKWLKGRLFIPNPSSLKPNAPKAWLYETASCPWCYATSHRFPEGEGLSDDDFD